MKIISNGVSVPVSTGGSIDFSVDSTLTMTSSNVLGVSTPVKGVLTQEEYDALPTAEKNKGVYFIPGSGSTEVENVYSLEETVIGRWIDGRPVYRKVFEFITQDSVGERGLFSVSNLNIDDLINSYGTVRNSETTTRWPWNYRDKNGYGVSCWISSTSMLIAYLGAAAFISQPAIVVIEYTKTTDEGVFS